jgi:integrase/recombinase XerD
MISFVPYYKKERHTIIIRVIAFGSVIKVIPTGIKVSKNEWDSKTKKVKTHPNKNLFNQNIQKKIHHLQGQITKAELSGIHLTKDSVKRILEGGISTEFNKHCSQWIIEKYSNPGTRAAAASEIKKIHTFSPDLHFSDITARWLMNYQNYMKVRLKNKTNTIWKSMKFMRTMLYDAQKILGDHINNPFEKMSFQMPEYINPEKDGLYIEEIDRIEKLLDQPHPEIIQIIAAKFLFMCYTGLRISDAKRFNPKSHLKNGERIVITSQKTGITTDLKLFTRLQRLLDRLKEFPENKISDDKFNQYLSVIAELAKIDRLPFSSHLGRHTFGCLLAEMDFSEEQAQKLMGHKDKKYTRIYFQLRRPAMDKAVESKLNNF